MATVISVDFKSYNKNIQEKVIDVQQITSSRRQLDKELILPAENKVGIEIAADHTSEPIKRLEDIDRISKYLISKGRYRDNMLFIVGINFGLRVSDLLQLRFIHLINEDLTFKDTFPILEKKTKNTRKVKRNRYVTINESVMDAVTLYLTHNQCRLDDYMFRSESNNSDNQNKPMTRQAVDLMLRNLARDLKLNIKIATHSLRKTFGYHQMMMSDNSPRKLLLLQKMFGHSNSIITLDYIGLTGEEIEEAYTNLNLGSKKHYLINSVLQEQTVTIG